MNELAPTQWYGSQGHTQGIALTLAPGYSYGGWRFSVEGGPWIFWQTWHDNTRETARMVDASFKTAARLGYLVGASIERGPFGLSFRHYWMPQKWNPYPSISVGANVLTATYRF